MSKIVLEETTLPVTPEAGKHKIFARPEGLSEIDPAGNETLISGTAAVLAHKAEADPHSEYEARNANIQAHIASSSNPHGTTAAQVGADAAGTAASAVAAHEAALDPHPQYTTAAELAAYAEPKSTDIQAHISDSDNPHGTTAAQVGADATGTAAAAVAAHEAAIDPHSQYTTAAEAAAAAPIQAVTVAAPLTRTPGTSPQIGIDPATGVAAGSMSAGDKTKLDGIAAGATANATDAQLRDRSTHTGTQAADTIVESGTQVFVTPAEKTAITHANRAALDMVSGTNTGDQTLASLGIPNVENKSSATIRSEITSGNVTVALGFTPLDAAEKGAANGVAPLGADSKIAATYLPSYVDDVLEYANLAAFPATGEAGKIYIAIDTGKTWRWGGSAYAEISASPGSTDAVTEGVSNLYFTYQRVRDTVLTGLSTATNAVITAGDTAIQAWGKLQAQITDNIAAIALKANANNAALTGTTTAETFNATGQDHSFGAGGTGASNATVVLNGSSQSAYGAQHRYQRNGSNVLVVGTKSSVIGDNSNDAALYSGANIEVWGGGAKSATFTATGLQGAIGQTTPAAGSFTTVTTSGNVGVGVTPSAWRTGGGDRAVDISSSMSLFVDSDLTSEVWNNSYVNASSQFIYKATGGASKYIQYLGEHVWYTAPSGTAGTAATFTQRMTLDANGNLLVGATSGSYHSIAKAVSTEAGAPIMGIFTTGVAATAVFYGVSSGGENAANTALVVKKDGTTSRSINAAGTINASGADYAEYMRKSATCGTITKGAIVGVNAAGELTDKWADSVSFLIKSTDPSYVGGDVWGSEEALGMSRPVEPQRIPDKTEQRLVSEAIPATEDSPAVEAVYETIITEPGDTDEEWQAKQDAYAADKAAFDDSLEAARQSVDRIAYAGQVPVNVLNATPGQYIIPAQDSEGIKGIAVNEDDLTFAQYRKAVGVVQNILPDGRANVRVKVC